MVRTLHKTWKSTDINEGQRRETSVLGKGKSKNQKRDLYVQFSVCRRSWTRAHARTHTQTTDKGGGEGEQGLEGGNTMKTVRGQGDNGFPNLVQGMGRKAFSAARVHKEKARDAASVTNEWLTKLKNQTKSERGKNKNAKAADKVTEMFFCFSFGPSWV